MIEKSNKKWIIQDWIGNHMYPDREFNSFEAGWEFVQTEHPDEEDWQDIYVVPSDEKGFVITTEVE